MNSNAISGKSNKAQSLPSDPHAQLGHIRPVDIGSQIEITNPINSRTTSEVLAKVSTDPVVKCSPNPSKSTPVAQCAELSPQLNSVEKTPIYSTINNNPNLTYIQSKSQKIQSGRSIERDPVYNNNPIQSNRYNYRRDTTKELANTNRDGNRLKSTFRKEFGNKKQENAIDSKISFLSSFRNLNKCIPRNVTINNNKQVSSNSRVSRDQYSDSEYYSDMYKNDYQCGDPRTICSRVRKPVSNNTYSKLNDGASGTSNQRRMFQSLSEYSHIIGDNVEGLVPTSDGQQGLRSDIRELIEILKASNIDSQKKTIRPSNKKEIRPIPLKSQSRSSVKQPMSDLKLPPAVFKYLYQPSKKSTKNHSIKGKSTNNNANGGDNISNNSCNSTRNVPAEAFNDESSNEQPDNDKPCDLENIPISIDTPTANDDGMDDLLDCMISGHEGVDEIQKSRLENLTDLKPYLESKKINVNEPYMQCLLYFKYNADNSINCFIYCFNRIFRSVTLLLRNVFK